ncbi:hypothetical protein KFE25_009268 [Diacronema lutheri]|uniref:Nudix hydrolase domain-containing protein n=2 Tax=Diacronema lutheri TaxID=2081491 RepID=A0A8J5XY11_DIALT|nr:hypothetical protein KFE25_009268 [Diacronema lutheri]
MLLDRAPAPVVVHAPAGGAAGSACVVQALGCARSVRAALGAAEGHVLYRENPSKHGPLVELFAPTDPAANAPDAGCVAVVLGHQEAFGVPCTCPASADDAAGTLASVRLAAVAMATDQLGRVLLTRRPASMLTFPGCWVLPGGSVDTSDASVADAALRELREETGLVGAVLASPPLLWESCYPTTQAGWADARREGRRTSHHLVVFVEVRVSSASDLALHSNECDAACWVYPADICVHADARDRARDDLLRREHEAAAGSADARPISAARLDGMYPNELGEGVGRGHRWAIEQLFLRTQSTHFA